MQMWPLVPIGAMTMLAVLFNRRKFTLDASGLVTPQGHTVAQPCPRGSAIVRLIATADADDGIVRPRPPTVSCVPRIGTEAGVAVVGPRKAEWQDRVAGWSKAGLSHLCLRTLGGGLDAQAHIDTMRRAHAEVPG